MENNRLPPETRRGLYTTLNRLVQSSWASFMLIFLLGFGLQCCKLAQINPRYLIPHTRWELSAIAISLLETGQFANPYMIPTGPTAHLPPFYPALYSLIYRLFGLTAAAGYVSLLTIAVAGALLYALLPWLAGELGIGRPAGLLGGLIGALTTDWQGHGEYLAGLALGLLMVAFLQRWGTRQPSWHSTLLIGLTSGAVFHVQPALLPVILGWMLFELWWRRSRRTAALLGVLALGIVIICLPWAWRNYTTFNAVFFIRSNLGLELQVGNHEGAQAAIDTMDFSDKSIHPRVNFPEARLLREVGEIAYMRGALDSALTWIKTHPLEFLHLTMERIFYFWAGPWYLPKIAVSVSALTILAGLGIWRLAGHLTVPQQAAYLFPLITFPLIYYVVGYLPRYRAPIDWIVFMLAGAALCDLASKRKNSMTGEAHG